MSILYIVRGAPGSGKSTLAKQLCGDRVVAADDAPGLYNPDGSYNIELQGVSHVWCLDRAKEMLQDGTPCAVANTFTLLEYLLPYKEAAIAAGYQVSIIKCEGNHGSIHNVPEEVRDRMAGSYEPLEEDGKSLEHKLRRMIKQMKVTPLEVEEILVTIMKE